MNEGRADNLGATARQGSWAGALNLGGAAVRYLNTLILTRMLGADLFGLYGLANTVVTVATVPASLGFPTALTHFVAGAAGTSQWARLRWTLAWVLRVGLVSGLAGMVVLLACTPFLANRVFGKEDLALPLAGLALALPFLVLYNACAGGLQGLKAIRAKVFIERVAHPLVFTLLLLGALAVSRTVQAVVVCFGIAAMLVLAAGAWSLRRRLGALPAGKDEKGDGRGLLRFSLPVMLLNLMNYLILWSDVLVMGAFRADAEVGVYILASRLATAVNMPTEALSASLAPSFSGLREKGDADGLARLYRTSTRWIFLAATFIALPLAVAGKYVLALFGPEYTAGALALLLLALGQAFSGAFGANGTLITMTGHPRVNLANAVCLGLGNLGLMFLLVPRYGAVGAALSAALSLCLVNVARAVEIWLLLRIAPWDRTLIKPALALLASASAGAALALWVHPVAGAAAALLAYPALWWLLGPEPEERNLLGKLRRRGWGDWARRQLGE
jgi:O-antigen/teichoic acid export membrane protein